MTKDEFTAMLSQHLRIDFNGSRIVAPFPDAAACIANTIKLALLDDEVISHGVQASALSGVPGGWEGTLMWLLSLRSHLLALTANVRYEGAGVGKTGTLHVDYQFYLKEQVRPNLRVGWAYGLEHAHLALHCNGRLIEVSSSDPWLSPDALCRFAASLLSSKGGRPVT